jgi:hypothetical protein
MQAAIEKVRNFVRAPLQVWTHSATLSFIGAAILVDFIGVFTGGTDSPAPVALLSIAGTLSLIQVFHQSPRDWSLNCHFMKHWKRGSDCRREQRERERAKRKRLEREEAEHEQALRMRRAKYIEQMKREARELRDEDEGGNDGR